jgi:ribosomal protein S18 acetylase RimI-like enzyme
VSLDCQYFDREKEKFRVIKSNKVVDPNKEVIVVLSNLAVRRDRRKQKIAQKLLQACENYIRVGDVSCLKHCNMTSFDMLYSEQFLIFYCLEQDNENWSYEEIYLQVDSENKIAQKLYIKTSKWGSI